MVFGDSQHDLLPKEPEKPVFFLPEIGGGAQQKVDFSVQQHLNEGFHVAFPG